MGFDSPWLVDFAIAPVNSAFNLPDEQVMFFEEFKQKNCEINSASQKRFLRLVEMTSGLVNASFSLPEWQAVIIGTFSITFFMGNCKPQTAKCHVTTALRSRLQFAVHV